MKAGATARLIHGKFTPAFVAGEYAVWLALMHASTRILNEPKPLNSLCIAPAGAFKSTIMKHLIHGNNCKMLPSTFTAKGLIKDIQTRRGNYNRRLVCVNDAVTTFCTKANEQLEELMSTFSELLEDHRAGYLNMHMDRENVVEDIHMGLAMNLALSGLTKWKDKLINTTFIQRMNLFSYHIDLDTQKVTVRRLNQHPEIAKAAFHKLPSETTKRVTMPSKYLPTVESLAEETARELEAADKDTSYVRCYNHILLTLKSAALLEARTIVRSEDFQTFSLYVAPFQRYALDKGNLPNPAAVNMASWMMQNEVSDVDADYLLTQPDFQHYTPHYLLGLKGQAQLAAEEHLKRTANLKGITDDVI